MANHDIEMVKHLYQNFSVISTILSLKIEENQIYHEIYCSLITINNQMKGGFGFPDTPKY